MIEILEPDRAWLHHRAVAKAADRGDVGVGRMTERIREQNVRAALDYGRRLARRCVHTVKRDLRTSDHGIDRLRQPGAVERIELRLEVPARQERLADLCGQGGDRAVWRDVVVDVVEGPFPAAQTTLRDRQVELANDLTVLPDLGNERVSAGDD